MFISMTALVCPAVVAEDGVDLAALARMNDDQLRKLGIDYLNLRCASDLPGSEGLDVPSARKRIDYMAMWVGRETGKNFYRYHREPSKFGSEARFKAGMMVTVIAEDFRCRYNPKRGVDPNHPEPVGSFFADSKDLFIHGFLNDQQPYGTCTSFPVLFAAVGRRLGYPIRLVTTKTHLFCRWEGENDRFNIEGTNGGMTIHPDSYYKSWPHKIDEAFIRANRHLVSQSPKEELAGFLSVRASCLLAHKRIDEAMEAAQLAHELAPQVSYYKRFYEHLSQQITRSDQP